jgi:hypothetical protein
MTNREFDNWISMLISTEDIWRSIDNHTPLDDLLRRILGDQAVIDTPIE